MSAIGLDGPGVTATLSDLLMFLNNFLECMNLNKISGYPTEEALNDKINELMCTGDNETPDCRPSLWGIVYFSDGENNILNTEITDIDHLTYTIRIPRDAVPGTRKAVPTYWRAGSNAGGGAVKYFTGGFIYIQNMIDNGFIKTKNNLAEPMGVYLQMFPFPCFTPDAFLDAVSGSD